MTGVTGLLLVGGRSRRMGRDKATLVPRDGDPRSLARRAFDAVAGVADDVVLVGRPDALDLPDVPAIDDRNPGAGPLPAVAGALRRIPRDHLAIVAACDMPTIVPALLVHLLRRARDDSDALCVLCATDKGPEPLLSVWRPAAASHLDVSGVTSLREAIAALPHVLVQPDEWRAHDPAGASFVNWNHPQDLP